ncbi:MAG: hypothetical protein OQL09_03520 [Gammaproteobacteria bacterium]|nr:hypothetical protein [Gammaproteobacteria bacterium]
MSEKTGNQSLLSDLKRLYSNITLSLFNKRMGLYNKDHHAMSSQNVSAKLSDHIEKLAAVEKTRPAQQTPSQAAAEPAQTETTELDQAADVRPSKTVVGRIVTALSSHFRGRAGYEMQPELSEKLKNSAWSHVHTALRYARQGDESNAKLHANIACNALKEAEHYMSDEACAELSSEVDKLLEQIKEQT